MTTRKYTLEMDDSLMYLLWAILDIKAEDAERGDFDDGMLEPNKKSGRTEPYLSKGQWENLYTAENTRLIATTTMVSMCYPDVVEVKRALHILSSRTEIPEALTTGTIAARLHSVKLKQYGGAMGGGKTIEEPVGHQEQAKFPAPICKDGGIYTGKRNPTALCTRCGSGRSLHLRAGTCPMHGTVPGDAAAAGVRCNGRSHACPLNARADAAQRQR